MDNLTPEENKAITPVQGPGGSVETVDKPNSAKQLTAETPEYIAELLKSNAEVIESNQSVVDAVEQFKEIAGGLVKEVVDSAKKSAGTPTIQSNQIVETIEIDPKAKYVVAKDKAFRDSKNFTKQYKPGDDVSEFDVERLAHLIQIGHVVKKSK